MKVGYHGRDRVAVSEIMAALLTVAITLIAGAAVFGFVNNQAAVNENRYAQSVAGTVNFLNEKFVVANMAFNLSSCSGPCVSFYIYNNGQVGLQLVQVLFYDTTQSQISYSCTNSTCVSKLSSGSCASAATLSPAIGSTMNPIPIQGNPIQFTITLPSGCTLTTGTHYYVSILGLYGNSVIYYSAK